MFASLRIAAVCAVAAAAFAAAAPVQAYTYHGYHIMPTPSYMAKLNKIGRGPTTNGPMNYYGGTVFTGVKVVNVIWGPNVPATTVAGVPAFAAALRHRPRAATTASRRMLISFSVSRSRSACVSRIDSIPITRPPSTIGTWRK